MAKTRKNRPTIAFLTDWSEQDYQTKLRQGVIDAAEENDANLLVFVGGALKSIHAYESQRNVLYNLIDKDNVDGIIIMSASIGHFVSNDEVCRFIKQFSHIPLVSIALQVEGIPSVLVDQDAGMRALMKHLIEEHGYRKIGFIIGPEQNREANQRFEIYKEMLGAYNIPFNPELVTQGDFVMFTGIQAVKTFLDERKTPPEVIVAANDMMALGALTELQNRKIYVPDRIAVVGFDNVEEGKYYSPPLTTVHQPVYEQGKKALEILLDRIDGKTIPDTVYLKSSLKIRESCGCLPEKVLRIVVDNQKQGTATSGVNSPEKEFEEVFALKRDEIAEKLKNTIDHSVTIKNREVFYSTGWPGKLIDCFYQELVKKKTGKFLKALSSTIYHTLDVSNNVSLWHKVLSELRCQITPLIPDKEMLVRAENIWHQSRIIISDIVQRIVTLNGLNLRVEEVQMRTLSMQLNTKIGVDELLSIVADSLPKIGISSAFISLYNDAEIPGKTSRCILAYNKNGLMPLEDGGNVFLSKDIVPKGFFSAQKRFVYMIESFFYAQHQIGFGLFEIGPKSGIIYENIRENLSSSLRGGLLFKQVENQAHCLEEQVKVRTRDLIKTNEQLQCEISERKKAEEALLRSNEALQQFAYIASHDLQEPLRMIAGYVGLLERRYRDKLDQAANEFIDFVVDGAKRMQRMINDLLLFSRVDTRAKNFEKIESSIILSQVLTNLKATIEEKDAKVTYNHLPVVCADSSQLGQIFQNLISNAIKFHGDRKPEVHINAEEKETEWLFSVRDNGIGIDKEFSDHIFIMFRRLHGRGEYPGSGIGLTICKRIIERHGGKIWVDSEPGEGSVFYFTIPKRGEDENGD